ncbi:MAG: hypothetical protein F2825_00535 [Actinobacteria bacterium]|uniref:Unannotated protein n=1 Tax=freshwater metagenome TaxID=449393 RepID=A0A6J7FWC5_9ZZZZ|nr:hypothetical protein [Actinomycetota bacterium]
MSTPRSTQDPPLPIAVRLPDGTVSQGEVPASVHRRQHLGFLASRVDPDDWVELAAGPRDPEQGWYFVTRRKPEGFLPGGRGRTDQRWLQQACQTADGHVARSMEMSVSYASRHTPAGTRDAVRGAQLLWADDDHRDDGNPACDAFCEQFPPHLIVASGGGRHLAWLLERFVDCAALADLQERMALTVDGDPAAARPEAVLRLAGTRNGKYPDRWARIVAMDLHRPAHLTDQITAALRPKPAPKPRPTPKARPWAGRDSSRDEARDLARTVDPESYFDALAPRLMDDFNPRTRKVCCPHPDHHDRTPSCHVFPDADRGWRCFGGNCPIDAGGDVFDLAAVMQYGVKANALTAEQFTSLADDVYRALGIHVRETTAS